MDQREIFRCYCGDYHYLDVCIFHEDEDRPEDILYCFGIVEEYPTLWQRIVNAFRRPKVWHEVVLTREQLSALSDMLNLELGKGEENGK